MYFTVKNTLIFLGIFGKISGEVFREFSEFVKFPENFPEIFLDLHAVYANIKIDFRSVASYLYGKPSLNFREIFREILGNSGISVRSSYPKLSGNARPTSTNFSFNYVTVLTVIIV